MIRTSWSAAVIAEMERVIADEEAFGRLVDLFKQVHARGPRGDCEAFQWGAQMDDATLIALGFEDRAGFKCSYDSYLMVEHGPRAIDALN
jgi:hypothetical protein